MLESGIAILKETPTYSLRLVANRALVFEWAEVDELASNGYMDAVRLIAAQTLAYTPELVLVDVRRLRGTPRLDLDWWRQEILPVYHRADLRWFAHVTGEAEAPGETHGMARVRFKMGRFSTPEAALEWAGLPLSTASCGFKELLCEERHRID